MDDSRTVWVGNISDQATEELLYELFLQAGPLERVRIPTDKEGRQSNFGFVTFKHNVSVPYAVELLNGLRFFDKSLNIKPRQGGRASRDRPPTSKGYLHSRIEVSRPKEPMREPYVDFNLQQAMFNNLLQMGQMLNVELPDNKNIGDYRGGPGCPGSSFSNDFDDDIEYVRDEDDRSNNFRNRNRRDRNRPKGGFNRNRERHHDHNRGRNNRRERHHESGMGRGGRRNHRF